MSAFGDAIGCLSTTLQSIAGTTITYARGATSLTITATVGQTQFEQDTQFGVLTIRTRDFIFPVADLAALDEPARGDTITEGSDVYEVLPEPGVPAFRYSDHGQTIVRVHSKRVTAG